MKTPKINTKDLTVIGAFIGILLTSSTIVAAKTPVMTRYSAGTVLGDESENKAEEKKQEEVKKAEEQAQEQQKKQEEQKQEEQKKKPESSSSNSSAGSSNVRSINVQREGMKQESETQIGKRKVKTKIEDDGKVKIEVEEANVKLKYEVENGELKLKTEGIKGEEKEAGKREREQVEDLFEREDIEVASKEGELEFEHGGVRTRTNFPLSINPETKELVVTTPAGQKTVSTLPDDAVRNMLSQGVLTTVATESAQAPAVRLETFGETPAYRIDGIKEMRLFGLLPISVQTTAFVSSENGNILAQQRSLLSNILSFFSIK